MEAPVRGPRGPRARSDIDLNTPSDTGPQTGHNGLSYRDAGVDIDAGAELVRRIAPAAERTRRPEMLDGLGGFAALTRVPSHLEEPVLVTSTDGVGTKLKLAIDHDRHDGVGQDLVAMCVNDVLVTGAEPLLFLDYYATSALDLDVATRVITGIARGCELAGCALAGGETAEMPGFYARGDYDLAGFCVGVVERKRIIRGSNVAAGDVLIALAASGPHSNGFSLIRRVLSDSSVDLNREKELLEQLLTPTRIYVAAVQRLLGLDLGIHAMSHITGGGLPENLPRMFPRDRAAELACHVDLRSWTLPDVFAWLRSAGGIDDLELLRTFNCGVGFVLCVAAEDADRTLTELAAAGEHAWCLGSVVPAGTAADGDVILEVPGDGHARIHGAWA
ncbi:MAG: phosphoribosylformylglycinamidine cyclo-ligase [Gammaproteobacteria bacterium]|nr:MAG: phosphoribosylformylglycinamidine cyclo-ligase [Gammaproteobacteria bacterium]